ncbi:MAG TPA: hypothetical protein VND80_03010 [Steroidobacteraceae bacterium]|nr:hypothetical protein [Steroidobacteraceae bacterium]
MTDLEARSRALYEDSVEAVDMRLRSRLTQARHAALEVAARRRGTRLLGMRRSAALAGVAATAVLAAALWIAWPAGAPPAGVVDGGANFADLDIVASTDRDHVDPLDMLQEDADFYAWAVATADQSGSGHPG